jgi:tetratricopeptide (TPR) repeat protein
MGIALKEQGKLEEAIEAYNKAIVLKPDNADAYYNMGATLKEQGKLEEAIEAYNKAIAIKPDYVEAYSNMGIALQDQGKPEEAIVAYNKVLSIKPDYVEAYNNMGNALKDQGKPEEAIEAYNKAIALKPDYVEALNNMGNVFRDQGKSEDAIVAYNKALELKPDYAEVHHNLSLALLATKDFDQGFIQNEWRWKTKERDGMFLQSTKPMWNGEKNQRVLVWGEQGIGDELMFSSIIPELYEASLKILVKCDKRLIPLFKRSFPADVKYFSKDLQIPEGEYDFHIPMGSLPLFFRKSEDSFKKSALGFLKYDMSKNKSIKAQLMQEYDKKIIGISWKTSSPINGSLNRNIDLAKLVRALDSSNTQLLSLQYGDISDEIDAVKRDFGIEVIQFSGVDNKNDIDGLAALMAACDQIVSTTNVTVHLAGALGAKVTALLPFSSRWIWGDGSESFWYNSVTPLKQNLYQNWGNVLESLDLNKYNLVKNES